MENLKHFLTMRDINANYVGQNYGYKKRSIALVQTSVGNCLWQQGSIMLSDLYNEQKKIVIVDLMHCYQSFLGFGS